MPTSAAVPPPSTAVEDRPLTAFKSEEEVTADDHNEEAVTGEDLSRSIEDQDGQNRETTMICNDVKSSQCDGGIMTAETTKESRLDVDVPLIKPKSLSPAMKIKKKKGNKRSDKMCKFFAKGRCKWGTTCRFVHINDINDATNVGEKENKTQKSDEVNLLHDQSVILAGKTTVISNDEKAPQCDGIFTNPVNETCKDVNDAQQKESRLDVDVPLIKDKSLSPAMEVKEGNKQPALMWNTTMISSDDKSPQCDGEIMTVNESSKQSNASDKVPLPPFEEQTTKVNTKDVNDTQRFFASGWSKDGTSCRFGHIDATTNSWSKKRKVDFLDKLTDASVKDPNKLTDATSSSKKRKNRSHSRKPWTTNEMGPPGVIWSNWQVPRMHVPDRAGWLMVPPMASVSPLINYHVSEAYRMVAEKEAEHRKQVGDLVEKLERAYEENDRLQRENVRMVNHFQGEMNRVGELEKKALALVGELERKVCD